jgi:RNA polymerase sigma factor (sigma-70 family)
MDPEPKHPAPRCATDTSAAATLLCYARELRRFFARNARRPHASEDMVQETYLQLLRFPPTEAMREPEAYLYRVAWHVLTRFNRRERTGLVHYDSEVTDEALEQQELSKSMSLDDALTREAEVRRILAQLSPRTQAILLLCKRDGLSYKEIAQRLGISCDAVKKHVMRGVLHFKNADWS